MAQGDAVNVDVFAEYERLKADNERMDKALKEIQTLSQNRIQWVKLFNSPDLVTLLQLFGSLSRKGLFGV